MTTPVTLRGITWDHPRGYQPLAGSAGPYAARTGVQVTWDRRSLKEFGDAPLDVLADEYDLLIIDHPHVGMAAESGCLLALDTCLDSATLTTLAAQSAGPSHASYAFAGHQWGLAVDTAMQASAYRPDLLDEPPPAAWDEVLALAGRLRRVGRWMAIPLVPTDCICCFLSLCASLGDPPGRDNQLVSEQVGQAALRWLVEAVLLAHPDSLTWNPIRMLDTMSQSDAVVYCPLTFCYTNYSRDGYARHRVRFGDIPGVRGALLGGAGFAVSAKCAHPQAACDYGAWLCSADIQRTLYVESGGQPGNAAAWIDDDANRLTHGFFRDTWETMTHAYLRPRHSGFVIFQEAAGRAIHALLRAGGTVKNCLDDLLHLYEQNLPA